MTDIVPGFTRMNLSTVVNRLDLFHPPRKFPYRSPPSIFKALSLMTVIQFEIIK